MNCPKCESKFLSKIDDDNYICEDCRNKFTEEFIAMVNQRRFMHEQLEKISEQNSQTLSIYEVPKGYFANKKLELLEKIKKGEVSNEHKRN